MKIKGLAEALREVRRDIRQNLQPSFDHTISIDIDDIINNFGEIYTYRDVVATANGGFGSLSKVYNQLVHPVIADLFNEAVACNDDAMADNLKEIVNFKLNDQVSDYVSDALDSRIKEALWNQSNRHVSVPSQSIWRLAASMVMLLTGHIRDVALDVRRDVEYEDLDNVKGYLLLRPECTTALLPPHDNPTQLVITLSFTWVHTD